MSAVGWLADMMADPGVYVRTEIGSTEADPFCRVTLYISQSQIQAAGALVRARQLQASGATPAPQSLSDSPTPEPK